MSNKILLLTSATRQVRQRWFSVCIFPLGLLIGLTGNRPQSAPACSFLRWRSVVGKCIRGKKPVLDCGVIQNRKLILKTKTFGFKKEEKTKLLALKTLDFKKGRI
jgi:hypothetical protein